jgi:hypothetical protein
VRFLSPDETRAWAANLDIELGGSDRTPETELKHMHQVRFLLPQTPGQVAWLCQFISSCLTPRANCLLWISEWGVWPSSENWHLYYRLRQSYGDQRLVQEAPGHLFLDYEEADLVSFLELGILNGWDMHLLPVLNYGGSDTARAFVSHDEWVLLSHRETAPVNEWTEALRRAEYRLLSPGAA